ncbi:MAG: von Willebrand factor type A domain-containing protein [Geminicoccaceae bacterium]
MSGRRTPKGVRVGLCLAALAALAAVAACERSAEYSVEPAPPPAAEQAARFRGGLAPPPPGTEEYANAESNPVKQVAEEPVSTFSVDVDTASYARVRRFLRDGQQPPAEAVRPEEMVNYFDYDYPLPEDRAAPFSTSVAVMPTPWNPETRLLRIGLKGYDIARAARPPANLVFLVDVSGSMDAPDKLPLVQQVLRLLVKELGSDDTVAIVTYAGASGIALEPTRGAERDRILRVIDSLRSGGSTAGAAGLADAYALAQRNFDADSINRVILATDGDFNVGITDPAEIEKLITEKRRSGVYLSVLGFGTGNLDDQIMQKLAQAGNGNGAYIDSLLEGRKVLVEEMASTLFPIADDVKIQIEFNPAQVTEYRLVGYETRMLAREDFNNDAKDAGEIGAGHTVTALYEITPAASGQRLVDPLRYGTSADAGAGAGTAAVPEPHADEIAFLRLRYKLPGEAQSRLIERPVTLADGYDRIEAAPADMRFAAAVAGFAQLLRHDPYLRGFGYDDVLALAEPARGDDPLGYRAEFIQLVRLSATAEEAAAQ